MLQPRHHLHAHPRARHPLPQHEVLADMRTDARVTANAIIRLAGDHQILSVRHLPVRGLRPADRLGATEACQQQHENVRLDEPLPEAFHHLLSRHAQQVGMPDASRVHRPRQALRTVPRVRVGEEQDPPTRNGGAIVTGPLLAEPAVGQIGIRQDARPRIRRSDAPRDLTGVIPGMIIHHDELEVRIGGREDAPHARFDMHGLVARGEHDRHQEHASDADGAADGGCRPGQ